MHIQLVECFLEFYFIKVARAYVLFLGCFDYYYIHISKYTHAVVV
jgi:hypothetical protein